MLLLSPAKVPERDKLLGNGWSFLLPYHTCLHDDIVVVMVVTSPGRLQSIVMSMSVCVSVCLSVHLHNSKTTRPYFTSFFVHVACGCGSVLLWRRCDMLCTSGFMDDVIVTPLSTTLCLWEVSHVVADLLAGHEPLGGMLAQQAVLLHRRPRACDVRRASRLGDRLSAYVSSQQLTF